MAGKVRSWPTGTRPSFGDSSASVVGGTSPRRTISQKAHFRNPTERRSVNRLLDGSLLLCVSLAQRLAEGDVRQCPQDTGYRPLQQRNAAESTEIGRASCRERVCQYV